jgi:hypothetical protein
MLRVVISFALLFVVARKVGSSLQVFLNPVDQISGIPTILAVSQEVPGKACEQQPLRYSSS